MNRFSPAIARLDRAIQYAAARIVKQN